MVPRSSLIRSRPGYRRGGSAFDFSMTVSSKFGPDMSKPADRPPACERRQCDLAADEFRGLTRQHRNPPQQAVAIAGFIAKRFCPRCDPLVRCRQLPIDALRTTTVNSSVRIRIQALHDCRTVCAAADVSRAGARSGGRPPTVVNGRADRRLIECARERPEGGQYIKYEPVLLHRDTGLLDHRPQRCIRHTQQHVRAGSSCEQGGGHRPLEDRDPRSGAFTLILAILMWDSRGLSPKPAGRRSIQWFQGLAPAGR